MESKGRSPWPWSFLAFVTVGGGRWLALGATAYFSLFHWMRSEYLVFSHVWQYGLPLLDPRVSAALLWCLQYWAFLVLVVLPVARWLAARLPSHGWQWWLAASGLALALGTRGMVGPIVVRALTAQPVRLWAGGGEHLPSPLTETHLARWIVGLTEAWWLLPLLVVAISHLRRTPAASLLDGWRLPVLLGLCALLQAPDAPYLLTSGGPRGATTNLQLLAFQLAFGAQEFGYASVLAVLLSGSGLLVGGFLLASVRRFPWVGARAPASEDTTRSGSLWGLVLLGTLGLPILAWVRNPPEAHQHSHLFPWILASACTAIAAAGWTVPLGGYLLAWMRDPRRSRGGIALGLLPAIFPAMVWVLPSVRVLGEQQSWMDAWAAPAGLVVAAPYLYLAIAVLTYGSFSAVPSRRTGLAAGAAVAWGTWTDLTVPLMLTQHAPNALLLPGAVVWNLSSHLSRSPLSVPGWLAAWLGGTLFALAALVFLRSPLPPTEAPGDGNEPFNPT